MEHRLFRAIVIAGCALPACSSEEPRTPTTDAAVESAVDSGQPGFDAAIPEPDTALGDVGDTRHPGITK